MYAVGGLQEKVLVISQLQQYRHVQTLYGWLFSDAGSKELQLRHTLFDYLDTTEQKLTDAGHKSGPQFLKSA